MVRLHWHVDGQDYAYVPPEGIAIERDTSVCDITVNTEVCCDLFQAIITHGLHQYHNLAHYRWHYAYPSISD